MRVAKSERRRALLCIVFHFVSSLVSPVLADLYAELQRIGDLSEFTHLCNEYTVAKAYMEDSNARITVFAPVDDVFIYNPLLKAMDQKSLLSHVVDQQVGEINKGDKWPLSTIIRSTVNSGNVYIMQYEHNANNFSYFANNGRVCNHVSSSWSLISGEQYLYKVCTDMGKRAFVGSALSLVRMDDPKYFERRGYDNKELRELNDILNRIPDVALVIYGSQTWNGFHTFFLPNDKAFSKVPDRNKIDREVLLAHVTGAKRVLFTHSWMFDGGIHYYPSVKFAGNVIEDNFKLKLTMRNITDRRTGRWEMYAVSEVYERYSYFRRGAVWARIVVPNIPVQNGVVHIIDSVLGIVSNTIDQLLNENPKCTTLMRYINTIGQIVRGYFSASGGMVTFFAPYNEAFERIPEAVEKRLLRDRAWLEQVLKLHIVPSKELTSDQINNQTIVNTVDQRRQLFFIKGEWPKNNITYYVLGGGVRAAIMQDNVAATNGIVHYIDRVLGVPYQTMYDVVRNETDLQRTHFDLQQMNLRYTIDPWEVVRPEQNFTFFAPTDDAWRRAPPVLQQAFHDGDHWKALQFVYKRHLIQGQALMYTDLRERTYVMMNNEKVVLRRRGRYFELYWPRGNVHARLVEGGQIATVNGFIHKIENVLIRPADLSAVAAIQKPAPLVLALLLLAYTLYIERRR